MQLNLPLIHGQVSQLELEAKSIYQNLEVPEAMSSYHDQRNKLNLLRQNLKL